MRIYAEAFVFAIFALIGSTVHAQDAREIIERGMKARSDKPELLEKQKRSIITMKGKMLDIFGANRGLIDAEGEIKTEWPRSFRWDRDVAPPNATEKMRIIVSFRADKGWRKRGPAAIEDFDLVSLDVALTEMYVRWLMTLYPLKDKAFKITQIKDNTVGDEEVTVVKVELPNRPGLIVIMSFSKKSGHLLRVAYRGNDGSAPVRKEFFCSDYKEFDGLRLPTKMVDYSQRDNGANNKDAEWTITSYKFLDKFDKNPFEKPPEK